MSPLPLLGLSLLAGISAAQSTPKVQLANGTLQGAICDGVKAERYAYLGVPYAQPPIGDLRLRAPVPFNGTYSGTYDTPPPVCPQFGSSDVEPLPQSEDCLFLDIWTPSNATTSLNLPVKVWIHGGSNLVGGISDLTYDGCNAATDAIQVSIAYRLGPLGGLALESAGFTGNYQIQDILLALQWIRDNIGAFGGNKDQILLYGQSAGADNTWIVSTLPQAPSLINAAIMESGGGGDYQTIEGVRPYMESFVTGLNCSITDGDCVRSKSATEMNDTLNLGNENYYGLSNLIGPNQNWFYAVVDCNILPTQPALTGSRVPTIWGSTTKEATLFLLPLAPDLNPHGFTQAYYDEFLTINFGPVASEVNNTYPPSAFNDTGYGVYVAMLKISIESSYTCDVYRGASVATSHGHPSWVYRWGQEPSCDWYQQLPNVPSFLEALGPCHTSEIPFVLGNTAHLPPPNGSCSFTPQEDALSARVLGAWNSMAAEANPGAWWPQFNINNTQGINVENATATAGLVDFSVCDFWDRINLQIRQYVGTEAFDPCGASSSTNGTGSPTGAPTPTVSMLSSSGAGRLSFDSSKLWMLALMAAMAFMSL